EKIFLLRLVEQFERQRGGFDVENECGHVGTLTAKSPSAPRQKSLPTVAAFGRKPHSCRVFCLRRSAETPLRCTGCPAVGACHPLRAGDNLAFQDRSAWEPTAS